MPSAHPQLLFTESHRKKDRRSISKMDVLLSLKLVVATILFLTSFASSELKLSDPVADPTSSNTREDKPLPIKISTMQYGSVNVSIYDSQTTSGNKKIYFFSPIALLSHLNVVSIHDPTATQGILSVSFSIWNQDVRKKVAEHLKQFLSQEIELSQVQVLPFNSARLTSKVQSADFSLNNEWVLNDNKPSLRFTLICPTREHCDRVKTEMRINPKQFEHLQLDFKPQFNDDNCLNNGVGTSQEDLPLQVKALLASIETNFANKLNAIREETKKDSHVLADKIKVAEENLAVSLENLKMTKNELIETKIIVEELSAKLNARLSEIVDIGQMPASCSDLQRIGHKLSGFFLVKGSKKMETVYCNFYPNGNDLQRRIGYADVKSAPVHFYVQRESKFSTLDTPIPFDLAVVNEGNAMDLTSGTFTAPRKGIYFFSFTGQAIFPASSSKVWLGVFFRVNGNRIGLGYVEEANTIDNQRTPLTFQSTLNLNKGDRLWLEISIKSGVRMFDDSDHHTHFTGFLLEEEIVASL